MAGENIFRASARVQILRFQRFGENFTVDDFLLDKLVLDKNSA
jgi:hypothetical protein